MNKPGLIIIEYDIRNDETRLLVDWEVVCSYDGGYYDTPAEAAIKFVPRLERECLKLNEIRKAVKEYYIERHRG